MRTIKEILLILLVLTPLFLAAIYGLNKENENWCNHAREAGYDFTDQMELTCKK